MPSQECGYRAIRLRKLPKHAAFGIVETERISDTPMAKSNIAKKRAVAKRGRDSDYVLRRKQLIKIAAELFQEKGYAATRPLDIAKRAGLDRASLYYYIGGKEELFRESLGDIVEIDIDQARQIAADKTLPASERLRQIIALLMRGYATGYPQMFVYIQEMMHRITKDRSAWGRKLQKVTFEYEDIVASLIAEGKENGEFAPELNDKLAKYALFGMLNWTHRWFTPSGELSHEEVSAAFMDIFLHGACNPDSPPD